MSLELIVKFIARYNAYMIDALLDKRLESSPVYCSGNYS